MSHRMAVVAAAAIGAALLTGAAPAASSEPPAARPAACQHRPDVDRNAGLVAGEPKAGLLYLATRGRFYDYHCPDGTAGVVYLPLAGAW
jgi:hypothetical protein